MSRKEMAGCLNTLQTERWRTRLVRRLAQEKVEAYGEWPEDFQLVGDSTGITELARLEERWLKLDR